jgi:hypothetical protein
MNLQAAPDALTHADARQRDLAADQLGDLLRAATLTQADTERAVTHLVTSPSPTPTPPSASPR